MTTDSGDVINEIPDGHEELTIKEEVPSDYGIGHKRNIDETVAVKIEYEDNSEVRISILYLTIKNLFGTTVNYEKN